MAAYEEYIRAAAESGNPEDFVNNYVSPVEYSAAVGHENIPMNRTSNAEPVNNQLYDYTAPKATVNYDSDYYKAGQAKRDGVEYTGGNGTSNYDSGTDKGNGVYGTPGQYRGAATREASTGTEWTQPGTGFGTGSFLGKALEDLNAQNQSATPPTSTIYGGQNVMVPDGGFKASTASSGTEWNQAGTGFGTGNLAGDYADIIDLMRTGKTYEEAQSILANRNELESIQNGGTGETTQASAPSPTLNMNDVGAAANSAHFNSYRDRFDNRENAYFRQMQDDFANAKKQFPNYSYSALADIVLFNNEMKNGQDSYYKWLASKM